MKLILTGAGLLAVVVLTHAAETFHLLPWMGWGLPNSRGHYVDLTSAIGGVTLLAIGLAKHICALVRASRN